MLCARNSTRDRGLLYPDTERLHQEASNAIAILDCHWCLCMYYHLTLKNSTLIVTLNDRSGELSYLIFPFTKPNISNSTFIGIAVHTATSAGVGKRSANLAAGVRQDATGLLGTTTQLSDLASGVSILSLAGRLKGCF